MFIFKKTAKEIVVTTGAILACCIFAAIAIRCAYLGGERLILSVLSLLLLIAILRGIKVGYILSRVIFATAAVALILNVINPVAWDDIGFTKTAVIKFAFQSLLFGMLSGFIYYCLGAHSKMRKALKTDAQLPSTFYRNFTVIGLLAMTGVVAHASSPSAPVQEVVAGNTAFAVDLYGKLQTNTGNIIFSPSSISTALAMTYAGARGNTEAEMAKTLHFNLPQESLHPAFAALEKNLNQVQKKGQVALSEANSLWPQSGYPFLPAFLSLCQKDYGTKIHPLDFAGNSEEARATINDWVGDKTQGKILDLIQPGILDSLTKLVVVNAIYFKGNWASPFDAGLTKDEPFHLSSTESVTTPLMHQTHDCGYAEFPDLQVLELSYTGNDLSMIVLLPSKVDGLEALEAALTPKTLSQWTDRLRPIRVNVYLPKFKTTSEFFLNKSLVSMGMVDAFDPNKADFSGMAGKKYYLYMKAALHKAFVEVNEKGTEAAAATAVAMGGKGAMPVSKPPPVFRADHPFLFLIRDNNTGSILFLGRVTNPSK